MEMEIKISKVSIQAIARLESLFGEGLKVIYFDEKNKLFSATISNTRIREKELFDATERSICDLFSFIQEKNDSNKEYVQEIINKSVEELNLSRRAGNGLKSARIRLIGELAQKTEKELHEIQNFGQKCISEVKDALADFGLTLGMKFENFPDPEIIKKMNSQMF